MYYIYSNEKKGRRGRVQDLDVVLWGLKKEFEPVRVKILFENPRVQRQNLVRVRVAFFEVEYYVLLFKLFSALCKLVLFRILYKSCLV